MADRPTILLITADELNREALGCYGATSHATPAIDRLASEGVLLDRAYTASPVCLPSRCSIATGLFPHNTRSTSNGTGRSLDLDLPNVFTLLGRAGYRTSKHGKCHFVPVPYAYNEREFTREYEHFILYYKALGMDHLDLMDDPQVSGWYYDDYAKDLEKAGLLDEFRRKVWECRVKSDEIPFPGVFSFDGPDEMQPDSWVGERSLDHIRAYDGEAPAFMWVSFGGPHYPLCPPAKYYDAVDMDRDRPRRLREGEFADRLKFHSKDGVGGVADGDGYAPGRDQSSYDEAYWRAWRHAYYASCVQIDDYVGRIVEAARGRWGENLLVIFTADHGEMAGDHGIWGKGGGYEQVTRVPFIVRFSDGARAGERSDAIVQTVDILPTVLQAAGAWPPEVQRDLACDGQPVSELLDSGGREYALCERDRFVMIADRSHKYVRAERGGEESHELYDLDADPDEFDNLYTRADWVPAFARLREVLARLARDEDLERVLFYDGSGAPPWAKLDRTPSVQVERDWTGPTPAAP